MTGSAKLYLRYAASLPCFAGFSGVITESFEVGLVFFKAAFPSSCDILSRNGKGESGVGHFDSPPIIVKIRSVTPFNSASISTRSRGGLKT